jgi:hypothetical protein
MAKLLILITVSLKRRIFKRLIGNRRCLVRQEGKSFEIRPVGLLPRIPESRKDKIRAGLELDVDRELSLGVFARLIDAVGPADKVTPYEISPIPRDMYRAYSSAFAIFGNDIVVLKKLVAPSFRTISTIGDDACLTVISTMDFRYVRFIVQWPPDICCWRTFNAYPSGIPIVVLYWTKIKKFMWKTFAALVRSNHIPAAVGVLKNEIDVCMRLKNSVLEF